MMHRTTVAKITTPLTKTIRAAQKGSQYPNYKIIGSDQMEYGPVSAEQIRQWIAERRVDPETKLQAEGSSEWRRLADVPEFAALASGAGLTACPTCGEKFEEGFDSCWKCGTGKDGSPPKVAKPFEDGAREAAEQRDEPCPKCGSSNVTPGRLLPAARGASVMFRPEGTRFSILRFLGGVILSSESSYACLDCGLVWDYLQPNELKDIISEDRPRSGEQQDAYALLSEGVRLERKGDTAGALAKYAAVVEKFPGTGAARDAECSIRDLQEKLG